jgi:predicted metal-dependent hydrolase
MMERSDQLEQGRAAFNRGEYFRAHELWEEVWHELAGAERILVQGLIQIAAGLHHLQQHRPRPAVSLLRKGLEKLSRSTPAPTVHLRIGPLARYVARLLTELAAPGSRVPATTTFKL